MKHLARLTFILISVVLTACATGPQFDSAEANGLTRANYVATDFLLQKGKQPINQTQPLLVATLVNIDNLNLSSNLGRTISEQVSARMTALGYSVIELKLRGNIFVQQQGELFLSREIDEITTKHSAQGVVVGTYSVAGCFVYITLKIVGGPNNLVYTSHSYNLPLNTVIRPMLPDNQVPKANCEDLGRLL